MGLAEYAAASGRLLLLRRYRMCAGETHPLPGTETGPRRARLPQSCRGPFDFPTVPTTLRKNGHRRTGRRTAKNACGSKHLDRLGATQDGLRPHYRGNMAGFWGSSITIHPIAQHAIYGLNLERPQGQRHGARGALTVASIGSSSTSLSMNLPSVVGLVLELNCGKETAWRTTHEQGRGLQLYVIEGETGEIQVFTALESYARSRCPSEAPPPKGPEVCTKKPSSQHKASAATRPRKLQLEYWQPARRNFRNMHYDFHLYKKEKKTRT